jgi:hypothetical protein
VQKRARQKKISRIKSLRGAQDSYVDSAETIKKIQAMREAGLTIPFIARKTGYAPNYVHILSTRPGKGHKSPAPKKVSALRAKAVDDLYLQIRRERRGRQPLAGSEVGALYDGMLPVRVTRLAIQGLQAQGWSMQRIAKRLGVNYRWVYQLSCRTKFVEPATEAKFRQLVQEIGSAEFEGPTAGRVKKYAADKGFRPTLYVDELI